jgi:hypothetical protein
VFSPGSGFHCTPGHPGNPSDPHTYTCVNNHFHAPDPQGWKYTITLSVDGRQLDPLDPWVVNK